MRAARQALRRSVTGWNAKWQCRRCRWCENPGTRRNDEMCRRRRERRGPVPGCQHGSARSGDAGGGGAGGAMWWKRGRSGVVVVVGGVEREWRRDLAVMRCDGGGERWLCRDEWWCVAGAARRMRLASVRRRRRTRTANNGVSNNAVRIRLWCADAATAMRRRWETRAVSVCDATRHAGRRCPVRKRRCRAGSRAEGPAAGSRLLAPGAGVDQRAMAVARRWRVCRGGRAAAGERCAAPACGRCDGVRTAAVNARPLRTLRRPVARLPRPGARSRRRRPARPGRRRRRRRRRPA